MKNKIMTKPFIIATIVSIIVVALFLIIIMKEKSYIINNGKDFEAKCIDVYKKGSRRRRYKKLTVYVFEVTYPDEIKGQKFEKVNSKYKVGKTYKGKYIDNGENRNVIHRRYEYQITE